MAIGDIKGRVVAAVRLLQTISAKNKSEQELATINRAVSTITGMLSLKDILEKVLDEALKFTGLEGGTICMVTSENTLHLAAHRAASEATINDLTTNKIKIGECLCGECARDHKPLILRDREEVLKFATREATRGEDIRFHAAFPIITENRCLEVLCIFTRTDFKPSERRLKILETISAQIALAVRNAQLYEEIVSYSATLEDQVRKRTRELEEKNAELKRFNKLFVDREFRIKELKNRVKELEKNH